MSDSMWLVKYFREMSHEQLTTTAKGEVRASPKLVLSGATSC